MRRLRAWQRDLNAAERDALTCLTYGPLSLLLVLYLWQVARQPVIALVFGWLTLSLLVLSGIVTLLRSVELRREVERQRHVIDALCKNRLVE